MGGARIIVKYDTNGMGRYFRSGVEITKSEYDAMLPPKPIGVPGGTPTTGWPKVSGALAVHVNQVESANARNKRHGVNVQYDPKTGDAVLPDRSERKKLCRLEGFHDNLGGYGDA